MTKAEQRSAARSVARGNLIRFGVDPLTASASDALLTLDDGFKAAPDLVWAQWYESATPNQFKLFEREWRQWQARRR